MVQLIKNYDQTRNSRHQAQLKSDMQSIENTLNDQEYHLKSHELSKTAHTSEQVDHGGFSVSSVLEGLKNRIRNLILNTDGTNVKEVVDSRVTADGEVFPLLKERLDTEYGKLLRKIKRTVNVDDFGADPTGVKDSTEAFQKAIGAGKVRLNLSAGIYIVKGVKLPSWTYMVGQGIGVTTLKLHEDTPASEWVVTNADHLKGNRNIVVEGMSLDWNPDRQGGVGATGGIHSSCLTFANVTFGIAREVEGINPGLHCFDASAPTYNISEANYTKSGCRYIWFDRCVGSGYGDDGVTTHYSEYVFITQCVMTNPSGKAHPVGKANSNGVEVDDGSKNVWVIDCYTSGNVRGVEVKAHAEWPAPSNVHITGCESFRDVRAFDLRHIGHHFANEPWSETARDVTLVNCTAREPVFNDLCVGLDPRALVVSAYQHVMISNFRAIGDPTYNYKGTTIIAFQYKSRKINVNGLQMHGFAKAGTDIHVIGGDQRTDDVHISNFAIHDSAKVGISLGGGVYYVNLMNGITHTKGGIAGVTAPNNQANIVSVRAVGYTDAAVIAGERYSFVPNNIKGGFRAASSSGSPLSDTSAIIGSTGGGKAKGDANVLIGTRGGSTTEGSRSVVMGSNNSHVKGKDLVSAMVLGSVNVINDKSYTTVWGFGSEPSTANKRVEVNAETGSVRGTGAVQSVSDLKDLAEYFESKDGNKIESSYLVTLDGDKIRKAQKGDKILGVISETAGIIMGGAAFYWNDRYLRNEFGGLIYETIIEDGREYKIPKENPDYDPKIEYTPREERDEWHVVGLIGQVFVRIDETVKNGDFIVPNDGIGTKSFDGTGLYVMRIHKDFNKDQGYGLAKVFIYPGI
ncbi:peptidase G2 autoproteolytic cleavage domain-containing protein [Bacillus changyiensis]|uniref:peptidase G2 autoproteolytic cleavage domain-containing protein n=1 Tax=Bacillus changyiensis TaxID=3004103 RepID=UPI0022E88605|nr:peptidase G2 autoproteolytic cleavage domain-containing protein [Bacillus changyiensis]MDA1478271.1 glycosyl hydrolase family 28-related protein [Bacillus changyiensis]